MLKVCNTAVLFDYQWWIPYLKWKVVKIVLFSLFNKLPTRTDIHKSKRSNTRGIIKKNCNILQSELDIRNILRKACIPESAKNERN